MFAKQQESCPSCTLNTLTNVLQAVEDMASLT